MQIELIQRILPLDLGKTAKLCLLIIAAHFYKKKWHVSDLVEIIGGDAKTVRFALRELAERNFVELVGKTEMQANIFELKTETLLKYQLQLVDSGPRCALERLSRQAQRHRLPHNTQLKRAGKA